MYSVLGKQMASGEKDKCCPLCNRGMSTEELRVFAETINEKIAAIEKGGSKKAEGRARKMEGLEMKVHSPKLWF